MYTPLLVFLAASFRLAAASPLNTNLCPASTDVFANYAAPASSVCACFTSTVTATTTTTSTVTTRSPTATTTTTTTVTAPTSTATNTATSTVTTQTTTTTTVIPPTITVTVPTTVTTTTLTCFTTPGVQTVVSALRKRDVANKSTPTTFVYKTTTTTTPYKPTTTTTTTSVPAKPTSLVCAALTTVPAVSSAVYSACSCVGLLPAPSTKTVTNTATTTTTLAAITTTSTVTATTTPSTTVTTTVTTTQTDTTTSIVIGATPTVTTTSTVNVAVASGTGLAYYYYYPVDNPVDPRPVIESVRNNQAYTNRGTIQNLNSIVTNNGNPDNTVTLPDGSTQPGQQFAMVFQGYIFARDGPGTYTISSPQIDDGAAVWDGNTATGNNWSSTNADYITTFPSTDGAITLVLAANEARAVTIFFTNRDGAGRSSFNVQSPTTSYTGTNPLLFGDCGNNFIP